MLLALSSTCVAVSPTSAPVAVDTDNLEFKLYLVIRSGRDALIGVVALEDVPVARSVVERGI